MSPTTINTINTSGGGGRGSSLGSSPTKLDAAVRELRTRERYLQVCGWVGR
jgi:hypothetical protein